jgi:hypothetical protein
LPNLLASAILATAGQNDWPIEVFDFNSAFLNGELDEEIFMQVPQGFEGCNPCLFIAKLQKALYRLKQGGRQGGHTWYKTLCCTLKDLEFTRAKYNHGVFFSRTPKGLVILAIHVDDCTITSTSQHLLDAHKICINPRYAMTDLSPISWLLGIEVTHNCKKYTIMLSQQSYIDSILTCFNFTDMKPLAIPMDPNVSFSKDQCPSTPDEIAWMHCNPYCEAIGSLMYAAIGTQPDIFFAVSIPIPQQSWQSSLGSCQMCLPLSFGHKDLEIDLWGRKERTQGLH